MPRQSGGSRTFGFSDPPNPKIKRTCEHCGERYDRPTDHKKGCVRAIDRSKVTDKDVKACQKAFPGTDHSSRGNCVNYNK